MIKDAVFDTGPILHLNEIGAIELLQGFRNIFITTIIATELQKHKTSVKTIKNITLYAPNKKEKIRVLYIARKYGIQLGEASALILAKKKHINCIFTDDLQARIIFESLGYQTHGTLGIILRAYRMKRISKQTCKKHIQQLAHSSLFITDNIIQEALKSL